MKRLKVMTVLGTRPEIIRLSRVMALLDKHVDHVIVHTGQNWDYELNEIFFKDLDVRKPDHFLGVDTSSLGAVLGGILIETEKVLLAEKPDAMLVLGDTNGHSTPPNLCHWVADQGSALNISPTNREVDDTGRPQSHARKLFHCFDTSRRKCGQPHAIARPCWCFECPCGTV